MSEDTISHGAAHMDTFWLSSAAVQSLQDLCWYLFANFASDFKLIFVDCTKAQNATLSQDGTGYQTRIATMNDKIYTFALSVQVLIYKITVIVSIYKIHVFYMQREKNTSRYEHPRNSVQYAHPRSLMRN